MTFASFVQPNGTPISITTEYVCAIRQLSPDTAAQVWSITDSSPGTSRGYVTVSGSFAAVTAAFGVVPLVVLPDSQGAAVAINPAFSTRVQALPGDTACRVSWAADQQGGYVIVQGSYAAITTALAYTPTPGGAVPGGPQYALQYNAGAGLFGGDAGALYDGTDFAVFAGGKAAVQSVGAARFRSTAGTTLVSADLDLTLQSESAGMIWNLANELVVNGNAGAPGEVLTSQGLGVPPSWAQPAPAASALSFVCNTSHNNVTPVNAGAFYVPGVFTPSGTVAVFVDSTAANIATVRVVDSFGAPVWTFTDPFPSTGYRIIPPAASPPLAAGWYRIDVACAGAGAVTLLGFFAA